MVVVVVIVVVVVVEVGEYVDERLVVVVVR